ncbi:MAG: RNA ligase family protein [Alphaproteobacteria bacterium]
MQVCTSLKRINEKVFINAIKKIATENPSLLPKLMFEVTEKIDGSLATFAIAPNGSLRIASKNMEITDNRSSNVYKGLQAAGVVDLFSRFANDLRTHVEDQGIDLKGKTLFLDGEIITDSEKTFLNGARYSVAPTFYIFDMFIKKGEDLTGPVDRIPLNQRQEIVQWLQGQASEGEPVSYVPVINFSLKPFDTKEILDLVQEWEQFKLQKTEADKFKARQSSGNDITEKVLEILKKLADRDTQLGEKKIIAEGVVLKFLNSPDFFKDSKEYFKGLEKYLKPISLLKIFHPGLENEYNQLNDALKAELSKGKTPNKEEIARLQDLIKNHSVNAGSKK